MRGGVFEDFWMGFVFELNLYIYDTFIRNEVLFSFKFLFAEGIPFDDQSSLNSILSGSFVMCSKAWFCVVI